MPEHEHVWLWVNVLAAHRAGGGSVGLHRPQESGALPVPGFVRTGLQPLGSVLV